MKLLQKQSVMMDLAGTELSTSEAKMLSHPLIGGLILFSRNFESSEQLLALITAARAAAHKPLLVAVDHEGGRVQRFRTDGFTHIPAMGKLEGFLADSNQNEARQVVKSLGWLLASECLAHDIDLSFAPVLDLERGSDVIGDRAFSSQIDKTVELASYWCEGFQQAGMACIGKHFPGHGSTKADSHVAAPIDERSIIELEQNDLAVFSQMIAGKHLQGLMPAHVQFKKVDKNPVGYSHYWLQTVLKRKLGFSGVLFSDDLSMVGAGEHLTYSEKALKAYSAGCDMLLVCNTPSGVEHILTNCEVDKSKDSSAALSLIVESKPSMTAVKGNKIRQQAKSFIEQINASYG